MGVWLTGPGPFSSQSPARQLAPLCWACPPLASQFPVLLVAVCRGLPTLVSSVAPTVLARPPSTCILSSVRSGSSSAGLSGPHVPRPLLPSVRCHLLFCCVALRTETPCFLFPGLSRAQALEGDCHHPTSSGGFSRSPLLEKDQALRKRLRIPRTLQVLFQHHRPSHSHPDLTPDRLQLVEGR